MCAPGCSTRNGRSSWSARLSSSLRARIDFSRKFRILRPGIDQVAGVSEDHPWVDPDIGGRLPNRLRQMVWQTIAYYSSRRSGSRCIRSIDHAQVLWTVRLQSTCALRAKERSRLLLEACGRFWAVFLTASRVLSAGFDLR